MLAAGDPVPRTSSSAQGSVHTSNVAYGHLHRSTSAALPDLEDQVGGGTPDLSDVEVMASSDLGRPSRTSSVSIHTGSATAEDVKHSDDFDDFVSVVSYASVVDVAEANTVDLTRRRVREFIAPFPFADLEDDELISLFEEALDLELDNEYVETRITSISSSPLSSISISSFVTIPLDDSVKTEPHITTPPLDNTILPREAETIFVPEELIDLAASRSLSRCSSSSSDSSVFAAPTIAFSGNMTTREASVSMNPKAAPTLGEGKITPAVLNAWDHGCMQFFRERGIEDDKQVLKASSGIANEVLRDWYLNDYDRFDSLPWVEFIDNVRARFLPAGWAGNIHAQIMNKRQGQDQPFDDFVLEVERLNARLRNTPRRFTDDHLRDVLGANIVEDLRLTVDDEDVANICDYVLWKNTISSADKKRLRLREMMNQVVSSRASKPFNRNAASTSSSTVTKMSTSTVSVPRCPALTAEERQLLNTYKGCYKCRRFNQNHTSGTCPYGYPDASKYVTLTAAMAKGAKDGTNARAVAAVTEDDDSLTLGDLNIAAVSSSPAAATSGILGSGSDSGEYVTPFFVRHTVLKASIISSSSSPNTDVIPMLIDSGSPTVLIRLDVVERAGLRLRPLPTPYRLGNAWGSEQKESKYWVKLRLSLPDNSWSSLSCRAIVVDALCSPVILGLPFLQSNSIVEDHAMRSLVHKPTDRDLLKPFVPRPPDPVLPSCAETRIASTDARHIAHRHFLRELDSALRLRRLSHDLVTSEGDFNTICCIQNQVEILAMQSTLDDENDLMKTRFADLFPTSLPPVSKLPSDVYHRFILKDPNAVIAKRQYDCPKKYREVWKQLLEQHLVSGRLRPSDSPYASPSFLVPKSDPTAMPRWVNDYRALNSNTVPDMHPLPKIADILADCAKGIIWSKIDMTDSFYQTPVHPDDIKYTAVTTPFGLYEWTVMPQGCRNAPSTHQRRMYSALRPYIGSICHVYLDDIIIWSTSLEQHRKNVETILQALRDAKLFCSNKKTHLFLTELDFLGHHISARGVEADKKKIERILAWPRPKSTADVRSFLGLVRYVASFLPNLAEYSAVLTPLTTKEAELMFPAWSAEHQVAFESIKQLVCSRECLTVIDHDALETNRIFVSCDASDLQTGAMLSFGPSLETARPVAFESAQLRAAELNYPVHEKELLAIVRALKKWRVDLLGVPFTVYTDHRTLENFHKQRDLSRRQARWQEFLAQYVFDIQYVRGEDNVVADALSRVKDDTSEIVIDETSSAALFLVRGATRALSASSCESAPAVCATSAGSLRIATDPAWLNAIRNGYDSDSYSRKLRDQVGALGIREANGLLYVGDRLVIPRAGELRESLFRCAHDALGHFGFDKAYGALRDTYYWPNMRKELETLYIPSCEACQRNKSPTVRPAGPLHPLPVPDGRGECIAIDFVGRLPDDQGHDCIVTITDRLGADLRLLPTRTDISAEDFAVLFFDNWYCENGLPLEIVSDRDKLFVSSFWAALHKLTGVKIKLSTSYHPETDGASERTNKTLVQSLRYHVARNQSGWVRALPRVRFELMNTLNPSTGFSRFQLHLGRSPKLIPPLFAPTAPTSSPTVDADKLLRQIESDVFEARDNLLLAKLAQASSANAHRGADPAFKVGEHVWLSTFHRRRDYMQRGDHRVAKFMVRYDGPYEILHAYPDTSVYTLDLPNTMKIFPTFHVSLLKRFLPNNDALYPSRSHPRPGPIVTPDGVEEWEVKEIIDHRKRGRGYQFLVRWKGYGPDADEWLPRREVAELEALDRYLERVPLPV
ncbi:Transposon Ty3-G Gag-Pol polyprotein [Trametes pubescens]|uniref:RNA-directed DNA polymerase n=1 Tax=Trametes pubescens TaxID=154538 RepID=A0A1M2VBM9_TRAPU|nr:Transposon Ty3-G Gag-Pol polyprotein [Trametes pubescens]